MQAGIVDEDIFGDQVISDPHTYYGLLRETDPVHWDATHRTWLLTRYEDVDWVARRPDLFSSQRALRDPGPLDPPIRPEDVDASRFVTEFRSHEFIQKDPPDHDRMRVALKASFTPKNLETWREKVRSAVAGLLDAVADDKAMDIRKAIGAPLPMLVISDLLGIPEKDRALIKRQADDRMASALSSEPDRMPRAVQGILASNEYLDGQIDERLANPTDDILSMLAMAERTGIYTRMQVLANAESIIDAGHETTIQLICNGMLALMRHRAQWDLLVSDPQRWAVGATEECLRFDPPLPIFRRVAIQDIELKGKTIHAGERVTPCIASANRDPRVFEQPDDFDITRPKNRHLSFIVGTHFCLGQYLARMEGQEVFSAIARRFPSLRLDDQDLRYDPIVGIHSLNALPVVWE